jgi:ribosome modulation factor
MNIKDYENMIAGKSCRWCEYVLPNQVRHYNHLGGWKVAGFEQRQWLSVRCNRCDYHWSLNHLGVAQSTGDNLVAIEAAS